MSQSPLALLAIAADILDNKVGKPPYAPVTKHSECSRKRKRCPRKERRCEPVPNDPKSMIVHCVYECGRCYQTPIAEVDKTAWQMTLRRLNAHESQRCLLRRQSQQQQSLYTSSPPSSPDSSSADAGNYTSLPHMTNEIELPPAKCSRKRRRRACRKVRRVDPCEEDGHVIIHCVYGCGRKYKTPTADADKAVWQSTIRRLNAHESQRCAKKRAMRSASLCVGATPDGLARIDLTGVGVKELVEKTGDLSWKEVPHTLSTLVPSTVASQHWCCILDSLELDKALDMIRGTATCASVHLNISPRG